MKTMGFTSKRKWADFIYALLLENEAFEQLLLELSKKNPHEKSDFISQQLEEIQLRRRFLENIFSDDIMIKKYVKETLFNRRKIGKIEMSKKSGVVFGTIAKSKSKQTLDVM